MPPCRHRQTAPIPGRPISLRALLAGLEPGSHLWLMLAEFAEFAGIIVVTFALPSAWPGAPRAGEVRMAET